MADTLLARLEQQRADGSLQLGSSERAGQLVLAAAHLGHEALARHGMSSLQGQLAAADSHLPPAELDVLHSALHAAARGGHVAILQALLSSQLPLDLSVENQHQQGLL